MAHEVHGFIKDLRRGGRNARLSEKPERNWKKTRGPLGFRSLETTSFYDDRPAN